MISNFFINRPKFAMVISIIIIIAGAISLSTLPISQYPEITPPIIQVSAVYPGAAAEEVAQTVAAPIEQQVNGVDNMTYMYSTCTNDGNMELTIIFEIGTNIDIAQVQVQNRVNLAQPQLPQEVIKQGLTVQKASTNLLMIANLRSKSPVYDELYLSNYADINIIDALKRLKGVSNVRLLGGSLYAMRIWLKPDRLSKLGLTVTDVANAIREQNVQSAAGRLGQEPMKPGVDITYPVTVKGRLEEVKEFMDIIVRSTTDGSMVRIRDIARVELAAQDYVLTSRLDGKPSTAIGIYLQTGANALELAKEVHATMKELSKSFPDGIEYLVPYDTTLFIKESIKEVFITLLQAMVLVFLVVFIFLQNWRATLIPSLAVPISLIGAFAVMQPLGFSVNTLTLFGMVLAIGIVVDDAIVVVENVERLMNQEGLSPKEAARKAMKELTGPVIAIALVLSAVFVPVAFLGGMAGQLYRQFAVTIAISVIISAFVALTLSPALCALLLKPGHTSKGWLFRHFNRLFDRMIGGYSRIVQIILKRIGRTVVIYLALIACVIILVRILPTAFFPDEDQGYFFVSVQLPDGASAQRTSEVVERVESIMLSKPGVDHIISLNGYSILNSIASADMATVIATLKPWKERESRELKLDAIINACNLEFRKIKEAIVFSFNPPSIPGLGVAGGFEFQVQDRSVSDPKRFAEVTKELVAKANQRHDITGVHSSARPEVPQLYFDLDRNKTKTLGIPVSNIFDTLQTYLGSLYVNDFNKFGRIYRVELQAEAEFRSKPEDISQLYVRSTNGQMVPISGLATTTLTTGPGTYDRFNLYHSNRITGSAAPGYSSGQAITVMEEIAHEVLPPGFGYEWSGISYQEIKVGGKATIIFALAIVFVFLFLAAQYESWAIPLAVILIVPLGAAGALTAILLRGISNDIYFQIGLVALIGLAAKNAILIVEFAKVKHEQGLSVKEAALEAACLRFRPILMTSFAFILGVFPLVIATGAGAASRHSIGTGVFGGMIAATFLGIFFVPLLFVVIKILSDRKSREKSAGNQTHDTSGVSPLPHIEKSESSQEKRERPSTGEDTS